MLYALDTNVFVSALRDRDESEKYRRIVRKLGARLRLPAVVSLELHAGARTPAQSAALTALLSAFVDRDRVIVPGFMAFVEAGRVISQLATRERFYYDSAARSFTNDVLIATSCRAEGATLITGNHHDFERIRRHLRGFRFLSGDEVAVS